MEVQYTIDKVSILSKRDQYYDRAIGVEVYVESYLCGITQEDGKIGWHTVDCNGAKGKEIELKKTTPEGEDYAVLQFCGFVATGMETDIDVKPDDGSDIQPF